MKIPINTESDYYSNLKEVMDCFSPEFKSKYAKNAAAHKVVEMLARGETPYSVIEQMITTMDDCQRTVQRIIENSKEPFSTL